MTTPKSRRPLQRSQVRGRPLTFALTVRQALPSIRRRIQTGIPLSASKLPGILFGTTIFVSAFLLFQVQPMVGKFILPWFGGSPAVWTTAMLFFQCILFAGYVYAHLLGRLRSVRLQTLIHVVLLVSSAGLAALVLPDAALRPSGDEEPVARILLILALSVGLPYFCLATTGPLLQHWYTRTPLGGSVFRLYALSNVGSFVALLSFPYVFEPLFELPVIGQMWTAGFWLFAVLCAGLAIGMGRSHGLLAAPPDGRAACEDASPNDAPTWRQRAGWVALPALASLAFIATTDHVSHDIAPEPRLWIATLGLYLLTFILSFDHPRWYRPVATAVACVLSIVLLTGKNDLPAWLGLEWDYGVAELRWMHYAMMFLVCFMCHGELYRKRPEDPRHLTEFYLWMSFGGACGGLFVALVATHWFNDYYEWTLCLLGALALAASIIARHHWPLPALPSARVLLLSLPICALVLFWEDPLHWRGKSSADRVEIRLDQSRNFYGTVSVGERRYPDEPERNHRVFFSGQVTHGIQYLADDKRRLPVTYYGLESGIGETLTYLKSLHPSLHVALVGLGAGTLATYAREPDHYDFFEINPEAVRVANQWFDNVSTCLAHEKRMIVGDARLRIEQLPAGTLYDVIVLDAFSGGSVPMHLLTREAFQIYERHLKPGGFIAINITNAYLNLYPVVRKQAEALGMGFRNKYQAADASQHIRHNQHFIMTRDAAYLKRHPSINRRYVDAQGREVAVENLELPDVPLWTDHFSSLNPISQPPARPKGF